MELNLTTPIIFFDLETTGINITHDRIVEICYIKIYPNKNEESKTTRVNPGIHIPEDASKVHGIYDKDVANCPTFKDIAAEIASTFKDCDIAGFNSNYFDIPMLAEELLRAGINIDFSKHHFVDVQNIYHKLEQRTLSAAYKFYCGKDLADAHSALADTKATYEVLKAQLDRYPDILQNDINFLEAFSRRSNNVDLAGRIVYNDKNIEIFNFGKYKGQSVADILRREPGYYSWMMQGDFPLNTKQVLTKIQLKVSQNK